MQIPDYETPQVQPAGLPDVRVQAAEDPAADAVGAGMQQLGRGVAALGDEGERLVRQERRKANVLWAANTHTQYTHDGTTVMDGNLGGTADVGAADGTAAPAADDSSIGHDVPTGPSQAAQDAASNASSGLSAKGALNEQGMAASKYAHPTMAWLAKRRDELAAAAPNEEAKALFLESSGKQLEEYRAQVERHSEKEFDEAQKQTLVARGAAGLQAIGRDASAPGATDAQMLYSLDSNVDEVARTIHELHPGEIGDEQLAAYKQKATGLLMQHYLDAKDFRGAQNLFDQRREDLGNRADAYGKTITTLRNQVQGEQTAHGIVTGAQQPSGLVDRAQAIADFEKLPDDKRTPQAREAFTHHLALADEGNRAATATNYTEAAGAWEKTHDLNQVDASTKDWLQTNDPDGWHRLEERDRQYRNELAAARRGKPAEATPQQDLMYATWMSQSVQRPDDFKMQPDQIARDFGGRVTSKQLQRMQDRAREIWGQKPQSEQSLPGWMTNIGLQVGRGTGAFPDKGNPAQMPGDPGKDWTTAEAEVMQKRAAWKAANKGQEPSPDVVEGWWSGPLTRAKVKGSGILFDDTVTHAKYERSPEYRGKQFGDDAAPEAASSPGQPAAAAPAIPTDWKAQLQARAAKAGVQLTDDEVAAQWSKMHGGGTTSPRQAAPEEQNFTPADGGTAPATPPTAPQPRADVHPELTHPTNQGILDQVTGFLDSTRASYEADVAQQHQQSKPFWQKNAEDFEARKAAALKAHPGARVDGETIVVRGPDGTDRTIRI